MMHLAVHPSSSLLEHSEYYLWPEYEVRQAEETSLKQTSSLSQGVLGGP